MRGHAQRGLKPALQALAALARFSSSLSHVRDGTARMVDTAAKAVTQRIAVAEALVVLPSETLEAVYGEHGDAIVSSKVRHCRGEARSRSCASAPRQRVALPPRPSAITYALADDLFAARDTQGPVGSVASLAGIQGAKATSTLIPLCHPISLSSVDVDVAAHTEGVLVTCTARAADRTGVEMEALTGASVAALTVIDMCKGAPGGKGTEVRHVRLVRKEGGKSGTWVRPSE